MINYDEYWKISEPALGESEKEFFLRLSAEYKQLKKAEARKLRKQLWVSRLSAVSKFLVVEPNLRSTKSA
ncbi:hypothetical protein [Motiliproteus sp. MSK22-1]|uniref:hypothetical protein n=1 Tax=Motiliproteus sp. MSK22-1 TaxID=1897630 RepID=UPI0009785C23|nr:hypothetical protein [Motiliproteus sp. MSK22-1]OMH33893.1 hypothetical protein BGP75_13005 [Motiliproteus sp. MSK22-1]